ncbi:MAG: hypothetical protein GY811_16510 [Myxococcales bacterium]|nr:hypothetical protein [Myxococcales bacterium]
MSESQESQYLAVIRVWAALAWADDVIQDSEREAITKLISVAQLSDADRETAMGMLESKVELSTEPIAGLSAPARQGIYRAALRMAMVDLDMAKEEIAMLARLREGLGIDDATASEIEDALSPS